MTEETQQPDSKEDIRFLVEHFRSLASAKDAVIREYRELLERYKPDYERQNALKKELYNCLNQVHILKEDFEKLKKKNEKKKDSGRASK